MELQWPLILFTTLVAWSAGLFASQCALAVGAPGRRGQMAAWCTSAVLLAAGGIAVFFHLQHWERIFNGFGNPTSGITQELVAIVVLAVVAIAYLAVLRKRDGEMPKWLAIVGIVVSVLLVAVMAHSYMMVARPAWDSPTWVLAVIGNACVLGPATMAVIDRMANEQGESPKLVSTLVLAGSAVNAALTAVYLAAASLATSTFINVGFYFDPNHPNHAIEQASSFAPFSADNLALCVFGVILVGLIAPVVSAIIGKKNGNWKVWGSVCAVCALVGAICLRIVFYNMGADMFLIF